VRLARVGLLASSPLTRALLLYLTSASIFGITGSIGRRSVRSLNFRSRTVTARLRRVTHGRRRAYRKCRSSTRCQQHYNQQGRHKQQTNALSHAIFLSLLHPPNDVSLKLCQVGCALRGLGALCVCVLSWLYQQASCPLPAPKSPSLANPCSSLPSLFAIPFPNETGHPLFERGGSRLHHWLPKSQVPINTGRSS
jgi:hypothetical protein